VIGTLVCAAFLVAAQPTLAANRDPILDRAADGLRTQNAHVDPAVAGFARVDRLAYAARIASRAADGRRIVVVFVDVPDARLNDFRERLYRRLRLADAMGALVVATPRSITMHTPNLTPDAELAIIWGHARELDVPPPRPYTETLAELVYDTGLVIHNTTPGAVPRGSRRERNLSTFPGHFAGETSDGPGWVRTIAELAGVLAVASVLMVGAAWLARRKARPSG
jgi:hypothetical protein